MIYIPNDKPDTLVIEGLFIASGGTRLPIMQLPGTYDIQKIEVIANTFYSPADWVRPTWFHRLLMRLRLVPSSQWVLKELKGEK